MIDETETVRLFSAPSRMPVDTISERQREIHEWLEKWGQWNRDKYAPGTCASMEKLYYKGGENTPAATAPQAPHPMLLKIDGAVRIMSGRTPQHFYSIKLFYVERREAKVICRRVRVHWKDFGKWMTDCRTMVENITRNL